MITHVNELTFRNKLKLAAGNIKIHHHETVESIEI